MKIKEIINLNEDFGISKSQFRRLIDEGAVKVSYAHPDWANGWQDIRDGFADQEGINILAQATLKIGRKYLFIKSFTYEKLDESTVRILK